MIVLKRVGIAVTTIAKGALLAGLLLAGHARAAQCPLVPVGVPLAEAFQVSQLIKGDKFSEADEILEKLHQKNLLTEGGDLLTMRQMFDLQAVSPMNENLVRKWVDARPQSFFGQLNAGIFYSIKASDARGGEVASKTSKEQFKRMHEFNVIATGYLLKAMELDASSAMPHHVILTVAAYDGQAAGKTAAQWLQIAIQTDPKNLAARVDATYFLTPRWGGSFELLDRMVQESEKSLSAQNVHYLRYNVVLAKASHEKVIAENNLKAHELYKEALSMCENSSKARDGIIRTSQ